MSAEKVEADRPAGCVGEHGEGVTLLVEEVGPHAVPVTDVAVPVAWLRQESDTLHEEGDTHRQMAATVAQRVGDHAVPVTFLDEMAGLLAGSCDKVDDMALGETLFRVQKALNLNQKELARLMGCSSRTIIRYYKRGGPVAPATFAQLAVACHPRDVALAAHLAQLAGKTLLSMGLESPPVSPEPVPPPPPRGPAPSGKHLVDSIVCAAAEAMQTPPHVMRPALVAAFERAIALGMSAEDVLKGMATAPAKGKPATA